MGVQHLRTFKKLLQDCVARGTSTTTHIKAPGVYTGCLEELQQIFPQWYKQVYSQENPPVGCPPHLALAAKRTQAQMGCLEELQQSFPQ
eukprot:6568429-Lingulodinium_polyedra.AAC.1